MNQLLTEFKKIDHSILELVRSGVKFSFGISILSMIILLTYDFVFSSPIVYHIGLSLFQTSLFFMVGFVICGFAFNKIKKELS